MTMVLGYGALAVVVSAVIARVALSVRSGSTPWWRWAYTVAIVCVAGAVASLLFGEALGESRRPSCWSSPTT